jgi:hypothetical protein
MEGKRHPLFDRDFALPSLRHTMVIRLGETGVDAFTVIGIGGHGKIVVLQRHIHPPRWQ